MNGNGENQNDRHAQNRPEKYSNRPFNIYIYFEQKKTKRSNLSFYARFFLLLLFFSRVCLVCYVHCIIDRICVCTNAIHYSKATQQYNVYYDNHINTRSVAKAATAYVCERKRKESVDDRRFTVHSQHSHAINIFHFDFDDDTRTQWTNEWGIDEEQQKERNKKKYEND